jgi:hypothetical protein
VRSKSPPPLRNQLRSQPAVYQLHLVQDLSFLNTAATQEVIWKVVDEVWGRTSSADVARAFIQAYRVMGKIIAEGGNNHWLQNVGPHFNLRRDYVDTLTGCKKKQHPIY